MAGMPPGMYEFLVKKYAILQQQADADSARAAAATTSANANANLDVVRAGLLPSESAASIGLTRAQTAESGARKSNIEEETKYVGPVANANIYNTRQQGSLYGSQAIGQGQLNKLSNFTFRGLGATSIDDQVQAALRMGMGQFGN